jgi:hypothetical protein
MANSDKNIRIIPNRNSTTDTPFIRFTGQSNNPILLRVLDDNTLSFEGTAGQLLSINNNLSSGWIFAVSDISGIPSFRVNADGTIGLAEYSGNIGIGTAGATPPFKITAGTNTATSTATPLTISLGGTYSSTAGANPKLRLYYDGTNSSGFGYSNNQLESIARSTDDFVWYFGGTQKARLTAAGNLGLTAAGTVSSKFFLETNSSAQIGIVIKGSASQTGNLLELQDSTGAVKTYFTGDGRLRISGVVNHADGSTPKLSVFHDNSVGGGILIKGTNSDIFAAIEVHNNPGATVRIFPSGLVEAIKYTGNQIVLNSTNYPGYTEFIMFNSPASLMQFNAGGTIALQRNFNIQGHELRFIGSPTTISKSVVVQLSGANYASTNCTIDENIVFRVLTNITTAKGIVVQAATSQTANLLEFQNSSSGILSFVNPSGSFLPTTSGLALGGGSNRWNLYATSGDFNNTVSLSPTASTTELRFYELAANGVDYTAFKAPNIHEQSITYTLPAVAPALNQVLTASSVSGGNVTLSWGAASSGTLSGGGTQYKIPMWTNTSSLGDSIISQNAGATQITVDGNFRATTKSFLIDHPSFPGKLLEHGSLEGPEHGAYVRGRASGINYVTIQLPDYWKDLVEEDYSIYITSRCNSSLFVVSQSQNSFKISRTGLVFLRKIKIEFDYYCVGDRKDQKLELVQDKV